MASRLTSTRWSMCNVGSIDPEGMRYGLTMKAWIPSARPTATARITTSSTIELVSDFLVAVTPHVTALLFGRYVLKMNPLILLGACSGAGTVTAALRAIQDEAGSRLPVLGYTVPYAIGNILLTAWGPVIVVLTS